MRYYPRLGIFKDSNNRNNFDGKRATSYGWYTYAVKLDDGTFVMCRNNYSTVTAGQMSAFRSIVGYENISRTIIAPQGLTDLETAERETHRNIERLNGELLNKRNRNISGRKAEIEILKKDLETIKFLRSDKSFTSITGNRYRKVG